MIFGWFKIKKDVIINDIIEGFLKNLSSQQFKTIFIKNKDMFIIEDNEEKNNLEIVLNNEIKQFFYDYKNIALIDDNSFAIGVNYIQPTDIKDFIQIGCFNDLKILVSKTKNLLVLDEESYYGDDCNNYEEFNTIYYFILKYLLFKKYRNCNEKYIEKNLLEELL